MRAPSAVALLVVTVALAGVAAQGPFAPQGARAARDAAQRDATGSAYIRGRVVAADSGTPIRRAQVRAFSADSRVSRLTSSDAEGRFEFRDLPAGRWELSASKAGFVTLRLGQRRPFEAGRPIDVRDGQIVAAGDLALPRGAAITGRVYDEFGDAVAGARLQVLRYQMVQGARRLMPTGISDESDDTGAFRLFGLTPGDYFVSATLRALRVDDTGADAAGYAPTYYPGTGSVLDAQHLTVGIGQELANISFALLPTRTVRVSGRVTTSSGAPSTSGLVVLAPPDSAGDQPVMMGGGGSVRPDGTFTLTNVSPGTYTLHVSTRGFGRRGGGPGDAEIAALPITVGGEDLTGLSVATSRGGTLSGVLVAAAGSTPQIPPRGIELTAQPVPATRLPAAQQARVTPENAFTLTGLLGRRVLRVGGLTQNWMLDSITIGGRNVADEVLEFTGSETIADVQVVITDRVTEVAGRVTNGNQQARDYTVVVFPDDGSRWPFPSRYVRSARPDQDGVFRIRALPPFERYLAVAVDYLEEGEASDPQFLEQFRERGSRFALGTGETRMLDLRLVQR